MRCTLPLIILCWLMLPMGGISGQFLPSTHPAALLDGTFDSRIHSVYLGPDDWSFTPPILMLDNRQSLVLFFDYLGPSPQRYAYRVIHCTEEWVPSGEDAMERFGGNQWIWFDPPSLSRATRVPFFHYGTRIPNEWVSLRLSGNYVLQVADASEGYRVVLQRQFAVSENIARIDFQVRTQLAGGFPPGYAQNVRVFAHFDNHDPGWNPEDYQLYLKQNWNSACTRILAPRGPFMMRETDFGDFFGEEYPSGEEWQTLDIRSFHVPGEGVSRIEPTRYECHIEVAPYLEGQRVGYGAKRDLNGYCLPGAQNDFYSHSAQSGTLQPLESDYAWCYFTYIPARGGRIDENIELRIGSEIFPMMYNMARGQYEAKVLLKQGVYNYRYSYTNECERGQLIGGSYRETENEYYALLYYRDPRFRYARLIGWGRYSTSQGYGRR